MNETGGNVPSGTSGRRGRGNDTLATVALFGVIAITLVVLRSTTDLPYVLRILFSVLAGLIAAGTVFTLTGRRRP